MFSRSHLISQGSSLALAVAVAFSLPGHFGHDLATTPSLHPSFAVIAPDRLSGVGNDQSARAATNVAYNLELIHKWE